MTDSDNAPDETVPDESATDDEHADETTSETGATEPATSRRLRLSWGGATHHGRVRSINQDALFADRGLFVVADGMGGHQGGEVASQIAVRAMAAGEHSTMDSLVEAVVSSNTAVWDHAVENPELKGMGTTLTCIAVLGDGKPPRLGVVNVGDSRTYRWRDGVFEQLTEDHSYVAELMRRGQLNDTEAATHPYRNMLTRAIGVASGVEVDSWEVAPEAGDRFVLCSDGLVNELDDLEIRQAVGSSADPAQLARTLIERANIAGGRDNITVVAVFVDVDEVEVVPPVVDTDADEAPVSEPTGVIAPVDGPPTEEMVGLVDAVAEAGDTAADQPDADDASTDDDELPLAAAAVVASDVDGAASDAAATDVLAQVGDAPDGDEAGDTRSDTGVMAAAVSPFDGPADDDLHDVGGPVDELAGYELPTLDGDGPLPWLEGAATDDAAGSTSTVVPPPTDDADEAPPVESVPALTPPSVFDDDSSDQTTDRQPTMQFAEASDAVVGPAKTGWQAPVGVTWRALVLALIVVLALVGGLFAAATYARGSYHVAFAGDEVVIYQGRPGGVLWFDPTLEEGSGLFRSQLPDATAADVESVVEVSSLEAARAYVAGIVPASLGTPSESDADEVVTDDAAAA